VSVVVAGAGHHRDLQSVGCGDDVIAVDGTDRLVVRSIDCHRKDHRAGISRLDRNAEPPKFCVTERLQSVS
jgi:hypothetical protein